MNSFYDDESGLYARAPPPKSKGVIAKHSVPSNMSKSYDYYEEQDGTRRTTNLHKDDSGSHLIREIQWPTDPKYPVTERVYDDGIKGMYTGDFSQPMSKPKTMASIAPPISSASAVKYSRPSNMPEGYTYLEELNGERLTTVSHKGEIGAHLIKEEQSNSHSEINMTQRTYDDGVVGIYYGEKSKIKADPAPMPVERIGLPAPSVSTTPTTSVTPEVVSMEVMPTYEPQVITMSTHTNQVPTAVVPSIETLHTTTIENGMVNIDIGGVRMRKYVKKGDRVETSRRILTPMGRENFTRALAEGKQSSSPPAAAASYVFTSLGSIVITAGISYMLGRALGKKRKNFDL